MLRPEPQSAPPNGANDQGDRDLTTGHEAMLGDAIDDLIEADTEEIREHDFDDGPESGERQTQCGADETRLGDGRIANSLSPKFFVQSLAGFEWAARGADILSHDQGARIAAHFFLQRRDDGFAVGQ